MAITLPPNAKSWLVSAVEISSITLPPNVPLATHSWVCQLGTQCLCLVQAHSQLLLWQGCQLHFPKCTNFSQQVHDWRPPVVCWSGWAPGWGLNVQQWDLGCAWSISQNMRCHICHRPCLLVTISQCHLYCRPYCQCRVPFQCLLQWSTNHSGCAPVGFDAQPPSKMSTVAVHMDSSTSFSIFNSLCAI